MIAKSPLLIITKSTSLATPVEDFSDGYGPQGRLWLRDDLPKHVPGARIFLYEYNATVVYGNDRATFVDKANDLLNRIAAARKSRTETRPIIFISHSMGGQFT
ncbi:kinesin [Apiospora marii]|uniref:Kinesin n=1 Tax=Apiospora marii TaxID=335849 RepID=A0ABR1R1S1_9PEZI